MQDLEPGQTWYRKEILSGNENNFRLLDDITAVTDVDQIWTIRYASGRVTSLSAGYITEYFSLNPPYVGFPVLSIPRGFGKTLLAEQIQAWVGSAVAQAFEDGARAYAAVDGCCGTYHLHEITNPHTGEPVSTQPDEDDL